MRVVDSHLTTCTSCLILCPCTIGMTTMKGWQGKCCQQCTMTTEQGFEGGGGGSRESSGSGSGGRRGGPVQRGGSGGGPRQQQLCEWFSLRGTSGGSASCPYVIRTGDRAGQTCGKPHTQHRCFSRLDDPWRAGFGDEAERPRWAELLWSRVAIFDLDYDAIFAAMYALSSPLLGTASVEALHTFTHDSGASRCFFRDSSRGPVLARSSNVNPCPAVTTTTPGSQRVLICTRRRTGRHLATFTHRPGSSLYTLATGPPQVDASAQVSASGPVAPPFSCHLLSHQTLLWHHRLGHPSLPRLRGMHSRLLLSGRPRFLPPLPPSPAPPCLPCVEGQQRAAPHSSSCWAQPASMDRPASATFCCPSPASRAWDICRKEGIIQTFSLPASPQQNGIAERLIGLVMEVACTSMIHAVAPHFLWSFAVRYAAHQLNLWPHVSLPKTTPTMRWTGKVGDASVFRVWESVPLFAICPRTSSLPALFPPEPGGAEHEGAEYKGAGSWGAELGGAEPGGAEPAGVESGGDEPVGVEPWGAESEGAESGGAELRGTALSLGFAVLAGAGGARAAGPGGACTRGTGAAGAGGARGARAGGAGVGDPGAGGTRDGGAGAGNLGAGGAGAVDLGARGAGAGGAAFGGIRVAGVGARDPGAGGAGAGDTGWPQPYFVPLLQQVLGLPSSTGLTPPLLCPPPDQSQPSLQPASPLPAPSPYIEQTGGLTERREPVSRPASHVRAVRTRRHVPRQPPPPLPGTHHMELRPPSSTATSVLVDELVDFAAACPLDYSTNLVAESESDCPLSVGADRLQRLWSTAKLQGGSAGVSEIGESAVDLSPMLVAPHRETAPQLTAGEHDVRPCCRRRELQRANSLPVLLLLALLCLLVIECQLGVGIDQDRRLRESMSMLIAPEGDPDAPDIATPRSYSESITDYLLLLVADSHGCRDGILAPREWHDKLRTSLAALGFAPSTADPSLFLRTDTSLPPFYVPVYFDDLVFVTADIEAVALVKSELQKRHTCTDVCELRSNLGLQITRDRARRTITLTQSHMVHQILQRFGFRYSLPQSTPQPTGHLLSAPPFDESVASSGPYAELVGCLMYLT
ncbi:unnamed protein product [Closterium sp. NIES-54]